MLWLGLTDSGLRVRSSADSGAGRRWQEALAALRMAVAQTGDVVC